MSRKDQITGKGPMSGNHVSHANNKVRRTFAVNLQKKRFYVPEEDRWVTLRVSTQTIKTINKNGISAVLRKARAAGVAL
jgi:large subunit ribosomal protein L28